VLEHRAIFVNSLRSSSDETRWRIFDNIERHYAHAFANGRAGIDLYEGLLSALRDSGMPEITKEFERRFSPLLSPSPHTASQKLGPREEMTDHDLDVTTVLHLRPLIKEFPLLSPDPPHSNANLAPRKEIRWRPLRRFAVDQLVAKLRASLEPINAAIARIRAVASEITTAVNDRPCRDWRRRSILYVAAFSSIAMLGVFVICASFVSSPDVLAQAVNGGAPAGAPQAQRPPTSTSKLLQPNHDPKEVGSSLPADVTPSGGSRQPVVPAVLAQADRSVSGVRNTSSVSVQAGRPRAVERNVGQRITIPGGVLVLPEVAYYGVPVILDVPGLGFVDVPEKEYARLYERLASSDPEQIEAAMVSLRAIKAAEDLEIEAAQRRPALSSDDTYLERDLSEPISFDRPSSSSRRPGRSLGLY
jgi:hypothetical protein